LEQKDRGKTGGAGMGAVCVLTLVCVWSLAGNALAQGSPANNTASSGSSSSTKASSTKSATATAHAKTSAAGATSKTKAHTASHAVAGTHAKSSTAAAGHNGKAKRTNASLRNKKKTTGRGQQKIDPERAQAIQEALIREHYLSGEAAGSWNQASEDAMRKYQADHGWQSKTVPDSRALISLGLGPSNDHLLNPESAMTTGPDALHTASARSTSPTSSSTSPVSRSAQPGTDGNTNPALPGDPVPASTSGHDGTGPQ
jgi:hypothetical protein